MSEGTKEVSADFDEAAARAASDDRGAMSGDSAEDAARAASMGREPNTGNEHDAGDVSGLKQTSEEPAAGDPKPAEAAAEAEAKPTQDETGSSPIPEGEWPTTTNRNLNAALGIMKDKGMTPAEADAVFAEYAKTGNPDTIKRDVLVEKLGADQASLVETGVKDFYVAEGQRNLQITRAGHEAVGGEENFTKVVQYCRDKASKDKAFAAEYEQYKEMINKSEVQARMVMTRLKEVYESDSNNSTLNATSGNVQKGDGGKPQTSLKPFASKKEYGDQLRAAASRRDNKKIAELNQRWASTKHLM